MKWRKYIRVSGRPTRVFDSYPQVFYDELYLDEKTCIYQSDYYYPEEWLREDNRRSATMEEIKLYKRYIMAIQLMDR